MNSMKVWLGAFRLRTLPLSISGIIMGSAAAFYQGYMDQTIFVLALITTVLFQLISNLANDLGDGLKGTDNDQRIGPGRAIQHGLISKKEMITAIVLLSLLSLLSSTWLISIGTRGMSSYILGFYGLLAVLCVLAAITYTVGKRAYGYHGLGDLMVLLFFGFVSVLGVYSLYTKQFALENILLAIFVGLLSVAVLNLNNMRDFRSDAQAGKHTFVVKIGPNQAKLYHSLLLLIAIGSLATYINRMGDLFLYIAMIPCIYLIFHIRLVMKTTNPKDFDPELKKIALTTFFSSLLFLLVVLYRA